MYKNRFITIKISWLITKRFLFYSLHLQFIFTKQYIVFTIVNNVIIKNSVARPISIAIPIDSDTIVIDKPIIVVTIVPNAEIIRLFPFSHMQLSFLPLHILRFSFYYFPADS